MRDLSLFLLAVCVLIIWFCYETISAAQTIEKPPKGRDCPKAGASDGWILVWCDEFDYAGSPDPAKWNLEHKGDGFGNNELQFYTPRKENVWVEDGFLRITARKEPYGGRDYTSAKLMSYGKGDFRYGRFEIRAKMPRGKGVWPAIWMMPTQSKYGGWPNSGEIDIMEHVGYDPLRIHGTIHTANYNHNIGTQKGGSIELDDVADEFYVYAIEWEPNGIKWFVDDLLYYEFKNDEINNPDGSSGNWPFDQEFYLILNVAFGGDWGGAQGLDLQFEESSMIVDYVRVYERDYAALDRERPSDVTGYRLLSDNPAHTSIFWKKSIDDLGISHYRLKLNGEELREIPGNSYVFKDLTPFTEYTLEVVAVDLAGKESLPTAFTFTTGQYPAAADQVPVSSYVEMRGIQLEKTRDIGGGENVGYIDPGDYLIYKLHVEETAQYRINVRYASIEPGRELEVIELTHEGEVLLTTLRLGNTGGWQNWRTMKDQNTFALSEGTVTIKIKANTNNFNLNWFEFVKVD